MKKSYLKSAALILLAFFIMNLGSIRVLAENVSENDLEGNQTVWYDSVEKEINQTDKGTEENDNDTILIEEGTVTIGGGVGKISANTSSNADKYTAAWQYWSQGASKYAGMRSGGCRVTAFAKLLYEAGYGNFGNPDNFLNWGINNGFFQSTSNVTELGTFGGAISRWVSNNGGTCTLVANNTLTGNTATDKANIMNYINAGYYVILSSSSHTAYIGRSVSISQGTPVLLDSWSSWSSNPATVHTYTGTYDSVSKATFTRYRVYAISKSQTGDTTPPIISNVTVTDHDNTGYTVNCIVTDDSGIEKVEFPTWTDKNGQDDIFWRGGDSVGTETYRAVSFRVNISEHNNEEGWYNTHIYAWDKNGNKVSYGLREYIDLTPPVISDITVTDIGVDGYTVSCMVTDGCPISRVQFPTWTMINGQDDIIHDWTTDPAARGSQSGTRYTYRVQRSAHNYEIYNYITHIYAYDSSGNYSSATVATVVCLLGNYQNIGADFEAGIQNVATGSYITQDMDSNVTGRRYTGAIGQKWHFTLLEDGSYRILAMQNGSALDCWGGAVNETNIASAPYHGRDNQRWYLYGNEREGYYILPKNSLGCGMSLHYTSAAEGTNIKMYNILGGSGQRFYIKKSGADTNNGTTNSGNAGSTGGNTGSTPSENGQTTGGNGASANFVSRMYTVALGRNAESAGLSDWCNRLNSGQIDGAGIAQGFIGSPEFKNRNLNNSDFLDVLYKTFFDRPADAQGKSDWLSKLNAGMSREEVLSGFVNSAEFSNLCDRFGIARGTMQKNGSSIYRIGVRNFVLRMYTKALDRNGETLGVEDWTNRINTGSMSPEDVAKSFFLSREFINRNLSNAEYVETLYETFMDRASDKEGKRYWLNKLNGGMSREQVLEGFSRSVEFSRIMRSYGL